MLEQNGFSNNCIVAATALKPDGYEVVEESAIDLKL